MESFNVVVLVSGGGTNLQAILDYTERNSIAGIRVCHVISSQQEAYALKRAKKHGIPTSIVEKQNYSTSREHMEALMRIIDRAKADLVVLAGYLSILQEPLLSQYGGKIINIHPSLLPQYGGKNCYGLEVHKQVIENKEKETGATVHYVDQGVDTGEIIQQRVVSVFPEDTPEILSARVRKTEHRLLIEVIENLAMEEKKRS